MSGYGFVYQTKNIADQAWRLGINKLAEQAGTISFNTFLKVVHDDAKHCLTNFDNCFKDYKSETGGADLWENAIKAASKKSDQRLPIEKQALSAIRKTAQGKEQLNKRYIRNLNICREFLQRIRTVLTGQTIDTTILMKLGQEIYQIDASKLTGTQLQYTLSGFGSSPLNLTYKLDVDIKTLIQEGAAVKISDTDIYNTIWKQKEPYLKKYKSSDKKYNLVFNSKDAEIFVLLAKEISKGNELNLDVERYHDLRAMTGSRNRTSQFQRGDSGLDQVKLVTGQKGAVTLASHSVIRNNLVNLINATNPSKTKEEMMQGLKAMYLNSNQKQELENGINKETQELMQQAETYMRNLFTGTTSINTSKI